ncbi:DivIVA domain-containing protein [Nocardiopsis sp. RSe5-2]|uniref:DivIVA domain-containing protein n=1 Tax=Nocardiopsis endophytica TaxID=3018445 RepID=A0ABT4UC98_9ACTN|nr:DivIVA domain-containing protein [Nocardiopsis endophytica]MDA2814576.1 DivIVA domain-containing protein [Nocardiopsis endophytica]
MSDLPPQLSRLFGPERPSFDVTLRGYAQGQVDALVDRLWSGRPPSAQELRGTAFEVVLRGYDQAQVDAFVERAAAHLEGGAPDTPDTPDAPDDTDDTGSGSQAAPDEAPEFDIVLRGYDRSQVQELLDRYLRGDPSLTAGELTGHRLATVLRGYHRGQVDAYRAAAANRLQGR